MTVTRSGGTLTLDPAQFNDLGVGQSATLAFAYEIGDGTVSTAQTLSVVVQGRNDAPLAKADTVNVLAGTATVINASTLLANDLDPDKDDVLSIVSVANAIHGTVALDTQGNVVFMADAGFSGLSSFDYTASDGHGGITGATVTVNVAREAHDGAALVAGTTRLVNFGFANLDMQGVSATEVLSDGSYVVALSRRSDGSGSGIFGQRFAADGTPIGGHFNIANVATNNQLRPDIAALPGGGFLVSWESDQDGVSWNVYQQRFDANFNKVGDQTLVNTTTAGNQNYSTITALANGAWVVNWSSNGQDGSSWGVYQQRYAANGTRAGSEEQVNSYTANEQHRSQTTALADGGWLVSWWSNGQDGSGFGIYQQRFAANGARVGSEERVNATTLNNQTWNTITTLKDGGWVVSWQSTAQDGSGEGVYGRIYNADGSARGSEIPLSSIVAADQFLPSVTALTDGGFVAVWGSGSWSGGSSQGGQLRGQRFDANGVPIGDEFRVDDLTVPIWDPIVAARADGGFVVSWQTPNGTSPDGVNAYTRAFSAQGVPLHGFTGTTGADTLYGSSASDTLTGGAGADAFLFTASNQGPDTVTDFQTGTDRIEVAGSAFGSLPTGQLDAGRFALNAPGDTDDRFVFNTTTGALAYDPDGNGAMAATTFALLNVRLLSASDIWVVASA